MILYMGPIKIEPQIRLVDALFALIDSETYQVLGYPSRSRGYVYLTYNISHLPSLLQAQIRTRKGWDAILIWDNGDVWKSEYILYDNASNAINAVVRH